ncbi:snRNA-activating protein complex subunit isoform X1 [Amaranthus tricolor]|uniref:snRNA-activating protein complex subunit isoform X1 n=1 Tax=Amaranthus tricolor TaxID=29722 RepID=UPI0025898ACB|nr:snRNA-activating protein complex subunit isoform X1 [Amaranthus tricolor]XP_057540556.1 snRNA-activating protein complex subunit isoform X1 [Amaranthus tricolor]XP_057540561.1 snRNA-activating protein complex subunit isoform X1 [Amaranthus tricolor]XP_057540565.1 snRNA-activating protein complex subunit isoform X1 [Amaranthus tricolor]
MEKGESSQRISDEDSSLLIPRGGPIFVQDFVSPMTKVSVFESDVFLELESLKAELGAEPLDVEEDISVDELRIYSDDELVAEAMKIAFEDGTDAKTSLGLAEDPCSSGAEDCQRMLDVGTSASCEYSNGFSSDTSYNEEKENCNLTKRKGKAKIKAKSKKGRTRKLVDREKDKCIDDSYLAKVEHLAKIREKQEEDKASVKLHSFNRDKENTGALSSGNVETLKYLESSHPVKLKCSMSGKHGPIQYPEVILCVEIYHSKASWKKTQEFLVLGSQCLTELRDKIHCLTDQVMQKADAHDPSGYFLIEGVFCNDTRDPSAIEYSEPILDWLKNCKEEALTKWNYILAGVGKRRKLPVGSKPVSKLPTFMAVNMQSTRFCDLGFRLGTGYVYCHQGDCTHCMVIRDMRLIHPDDVQNRAAYPLLVHQLKKILKKCTVCRIYKATKVTLDDKLAGENPCYFCDNCYYLLHYSEEGNLLYSSFTVYDYLQDYY